MTSRHSTHRTEDDRRFHAPACLFVLCSYQKYQVSMEKPKNDLSLVS
jgi:hypothetical protein